MTQMMSTCTTITVVYEISDWEKTDKQDVVDNLNSGSDIVDVDDILHPEGAPEYRNISLEAALRPPVVTRSGRVVKTTHLAK
jgi:hypothetical protein